MTKLLSALTAGLLLTAGAASANSTFGLNTVQDSRSLIDLGTVVAAEGQGVVEVYDYHAGQEGRLLGSEDVRAGANTDVKVSLAPSASDTLIARLKVEGQTVAQQVVRIGS